ncbi:MAG: hypothetical protein BroJett011_04360 [Chloroflexota bacterium]|nr:MAG: hypothetical protein BroJett011_04360 [Chloroflexota bacterium]
MDEQLTFFNALTGQTVTAQDWQLQLKPGDYYAIERPTAATVDAKGRVNYFDDVPTVYGQIITNIAEKDEPAYKFGHFLVRGFSQWCPEGELGLFNICEATRQLTEAQFNAARAAGWPQEVPDGNYNSTPPAAPEIIEVHNAWTIYGTNADGSEADVPLVMHGRVQTWGDPRWIYHRFDFEWLSAPSGKIYVNHAHCWTDLKREPGEYANLFANLIAEILMPGTSPQLCGRDYLDDDDFWFEEWGPRPPFWDSPKEDWDDLDDDDDDWLLDEEDSHA